MSPGEYPGVVIDGTVPRTDLERCFHLIDYFDTLDDSIGHKQVSVGLRRSIIRGEDLDEVEVEIISCINAKLPDVFVCTLGEQQPGDVIVREIGNDELLDQEGI